MGLAMKYAVQEVTKTSRLYGYNISLHIINCRNENDVNKAVLYAFKNSYHFMIGPYSSETSYVTSILTGTFQLTSVSYSASNTDFQKYGPNKGYMLRSVPDDSVRIFALFDLITEMKWNYIGVVSSFNYNGERDSHKFINSLKQYGVCLANHITLQEQASADNCLDAIDTLNIDNKLNILILFTTNSNSRCLLKALKARKFINRFYLICVYGCTNYIEVVREVEETAENVLSIDIHHPSVKGFKEYFLVQNPIDNTEVFFRQYWESLFSCKLRNRSEHVKTCSGYERLSERHFNQLTPISTIVNSVNLIAEVLSILISANCNVTVTPNHTKCFIDPSRPDVLTSPIFQIMVLLSVNGTICDSSRLFECGQEVTYRYDFHQYKRNKHGSYEHLMVGNWSMATWGSKKSVLSRNLRTSNKLLNSVCSKECPLGYVKERDSHLQKAMCCWKCKRCQENAIVVNDACISCASTELADLRSSICIPLKRKFIQFDNSLTPYFLLFACLIGECFVINVVIFFIKYDQFRIIRASGRDLCYMILTGTFLVFLYPLFFFAKPSLSLCAIRSGLPGIAFLCCYAPLFLKVHRVYRIFTHAKKTVERPILISSRSLLFISSSFVCVQFLLVAVWLTTNPPVTYAIVSTNNDYLTIHCKGDSSPLFLILNLALSVCFMLACTVLAFKTRHFPKNYNEAKYIGITLYVTCVAWSIFVPAYFLLPEKDFIREYFMGAISVVIGYITVIGLFGYKIRLLLNKYATERGDENLESWFLSQNCSNDGNLQPKFPTEDTFQSNASAAL
ncbi:metabotropic glutamate receptor 3-like [Hydractinia symbiolongicarpus]|uniref:metabotropic glutamate receptor 3-like n=1 Tax=Hydractinia symbiolongicarpus TaxID=13093 RepID=UPI00254A7AF5|nr:metabotropic glutamate receptor 3-like [Hydractinia symbiolongicarpus]